MNKLKIEPITKPFNIIIDNIASDKSISHRAAIFSLLSNKKSIINNYLLAQDTLNTLSIIEQLGAKVSIDKSRVTIIPPKNIQEPSDVLNCGNSGTAMRLFCGLLSSINGIFILTGDKYLNERPMKRIIQPLINNNAIIKSRENNNKAPIVVEGQKLKSFTYNAKINSAQVKSALILSALNSKNISKYKEEELTRDHTENMLKYMGANINIDKDLYININPLKEPLNPLNINIPADPSSGFFFAIAASIIKGSQVTIKNVLLNETRIEAYKVLKNMGVTVIFDIKENIYEPVGDIIVKNDKLNSIKIKDNISWLIDELPALSIAMSFAKGTSKVQNAIELRVKESDRIKSVVENIKLCGIKCKEFEDGYEIIGGNLSKANINSNGDHRIAMSFAIAGLKSGMIVNDINCIETSFPNFEKLLETLKGNLNENQNG